MLLGRLIILNQPTTGIRFTGIHDALIVLLGLRILLF
jgi:hypothetical protein